MKEFEGRKLLVLGGGALACDIVKHAQNLGAYVIVADYNPQCPAKAIADKYIEISALDVESLVSYCKKDGIDGVTTGFVDILLKPCYDVCQQLELPCYFTPKMLSMSMSKVDFKETCCKYDVPVPITYFVGNDIRQLEDIEITFPVFVKPLDSSGSRGAGVCWSKEGTEKQFSIAKSFSPTQNVVIEEYLTGREFLLNYVAENGQFRLISMFDRYVCKDRGSAINYSNLAISPSKSIDLYLSQLNAKVISMFKNVGFNDGLFFLQGFARDNRIAFFEMGCRLGGSYYNLEKACVNIDPVDMVIRYAFTGHMTNEIEDIAENTANYSKIAICVNYLLKGNEATIGKIIGLNDVISRPSCVGYEQRHFEGDYFSNERTVDRPILSLDLIEDNMEKAKEDISMMNKIFNVFDTQGAPILMEKFDLNDL